MANVLPDANGLTDSLARLTNWLLTWVQPGGEIYGFHNHSVWGGNPYRWADFTSGHSTWASPLIPAMAQLVGDHRCVHDSAAGILNNLIDFQTQAFQPNHDYKHIGFQIGESLTHGLIHNAITNVSLCMAAGLAPAVIGEQRLQSIRAAFLRNETCHQRPNQHATCNQDYARIWAKLLYHQAFSDARFYDQLPADIDFMIKNFHVRGLPDEQCCGTYRSLSDQTIVEPAEYYGLMISPLVLAARVYGDERYLEEAVAIARHVVRSRWTDSNGQARMHRLWHRSDPAAAAWLRNCQPMLISGMGDSLAGFLDVLAVREDPEIRLGLEAFDATYQHYQHPRGFFVAATGWDSEVDVAPSSAWHAHDMRYLAQRWVTGLSGGKANASAQLWQTALEPVDQVAVLLGSQCLWVEHGQHWAIADYFWQDVYDLRGRKDRAVFGRNMSWVGGPRSLPSEFEFPDLPRFMKCDGQVWPRTAMDDRVVVRCAGDFEYVGPP